MFSRITPSTILTGVTVALAAVSLLWLGREFLSGERALPGAGVVAIVVVVGLITGINNPGASWVGPVTAHGSRRRAEVALTFDDGPNGAGTLGVLAALEGRGVQGTFFTVGKAAAREPETVRRIVAGGHLLGDHSYHHDAWRYLQPGYPELQRGDRAVQDAAGVAPRYYRPPHGTHTPFVWFAARRAGMRVVNWDVAAHDWLATDSADLARRIVAGARPGSIILLHDGLDGQAEVDRSVLIAALPLIIDGLRAKGLEPVRLDTLLDDHPERARR